jgi:hypothetical protein
MQVDARISLVNPISRSEPGITILELDCLVRSESLEGRVSAIRASNVLNLGYFSTPQIRDAVGHLHSYLREGGCFVASRNDDQAENGSAWRKESRRFRDDFPITGPICARRGCGVTRIASDIFVGRPIGPSIWPRRTETPCSRVGSPSCGDYFSSAGSRIKRNTGEFFRLNMRCAISVIG